MNNDLISRSELKKAFIDEWNYEADYAIFRQVENIIDNAPTVEPNEMTKDLIDKVNVNVGLAQPIKDEKPQDKWGKWVINEIQCPNCLEYFLTDCYSTEDLNSCPCCGAKMKGGAENDK